MSRKPAVRMIGTHTDITNRKQNEDAIYQIAKGVSATTGEEFFTSLVAYIGESLHADLAFIGELKSHKEHPSIHTIAAYKEHHVAPNFKYDLAHTPCENVVGNKMCVYPQNVGPRIPRR